METDLKNCPCCGGDAELKHSLHYGGEYWVECKTCGARTRYFRAARIGASEELAKKAWNNRRFKEED